MEEKRYPQIDEEQGMEMCCEPIAEPMTDLLYTPPSEQMVF